MCIQADYSMISPEKICIQVTLRANLSNGNWVLSFGYKFLHRYNLWNCFIYEFSHFCGMIRFSWGTSGNHFYIAILETKHSCSHLWKHTELSKTYFFSIIGFRIAQWCPYYNPQTICGSQNIACCFLLHHIMEPDNSLWIVIQHWPGKWEI